MSRRYAVSSGSPRPAHPRPYPSEDRRRSGMLAPMRALSFARLDRDDQLASIHSAATHVDPRVPPPPCARRGAPRAPRAREDARDAPTAGRDRHTRGSVRTLGGGARRAAPASESTPSARSPHRVFATRCTTRRRARARTGLLEHRARHLGERTDLAAAADRRFAASLRSWLPPRAAGWCVVA